MATTFPLLAEEKINEIHINSKKNDIYLFLIIMSIGRETRNKVLMFSVKTFLPK